MAHQFVLRESPAGLTRSRLKTNTRTASRKLRPRTPC